MASPESPEPVTLFRTLTELLHDAGAINIEQEQVAVDVFEKCLPYYGSPDRAELLRAFADSLIEASLILIKNGGATIKAELEGRLQHDFALLRAPEFSMEDLHPHGVAERKTIDSFIGLGLLKHTDSGAVSPIRTFGIFPNILCRVLYPDPIIESTQRRVADGLRKIEATTKKIPERIRREAFQLSSTLARLLLTDLHSGGNIESLNIYELGPTVYRNEDHSIFIFSRTPGLVIPDEYYGTDNEYVRRVYFDRGVLGAAGNNMKKYYQWNRDSTSEALYRGFVDAQGIHQGARYRLRAARILARFFSEENMEITEATFGLHREEVKNLKLTLTLTSQSLNVVVSRSTLSKSIVGNATILGGAEGRVELAKLLSDLTATSVIPTWPSKFEGAERAGALSIPSAFRRLYDEDKLLTIKRIGERLGMAEALETVDRLLAIGQKLANTA